MAETNEEKIPNLQTPWEGYSGLSVEEFIKENLQGKYGHLETSDSADDGGFYHLYAFESKQTYEQWDKEGRDPNSELIKQNLVIPISSSKDAATYASQLRTSVSVSSNIAIVNDDFIVPLNFRAIVKTAIGTTENFGADGIVEISRSTDGGRTYNTIGEFESKLTSQEPTDSSFIEANTVNLGPFLTIGRQNIRLRAYFSYQDSEGSERKSYSSWVAIGASVTKTELSLSSEVDFKTPIYAENEDGSIKPFPLKLRVNGAVDKTITIKLYGSSKTMTITDIIPSTSDGETKDYSQPEQDAYKFMSHGVHKVEAFLTANDGLGGVIETKPIVHRYMVVNGKTPNADLSKPYLMLQNVTGEVENYVQSRIVDYAVYSPDNSPIELTFLVTDYTEDYENYKPTTYFQAQFTAENNTAYSINSAIEIEHLGGGNEPTSYNTYFRVRRNIDGGTTNFMAESTGETDYPIFVDNRNSFSPVAGTTFFINPKVRDNSESNRASIINSISGATVDSIWEGFDFVNDGWVTASDGQKVLRVLAGSKLRIKKNIFKQFRTLPDSSMTVEIDFAVHNVTNETDPVIDMSEPVAVEEDDITSTGFKGLRLNALDGWVATQNTFTKNDCLFSWDEGKRTLVHLNINSAVEPNKVGDAIYSNDYADKAKGAIPLARVLVDGDPYREISYKAGNRDTSEWTSTDEGYIVIGNVGADVDIYGIRVYENTKVEMTDLLLKNYVSTRPTSEEKINIRKRNDLMTGGKIDIEKVKALGINTIVWHGKVPFNIEPSDTTGWYEYFRYDDNGNFLPEYSGTNCKETKSLGNKGQGSTAKTYYYWNLQDDNSKVKKTISVALEDFHESIHVRIDGGKAYIYGGNLGKNFPLEDVEVEYPYSNGMVTVPDGWIDGNGKYRGMGYQNAPNTSLAQKKVAKINYASSMQSHLLGACKSYDLLHRAVCGDTPLQKLVPTAVSAKHTEPYMLFFEIDGQYYYNGLCVYGAGKMDKVTWGYVKKKHPMFALIEGSDNNGPMTGFRVPFDKNTAIYDTDGEGWLYKGEQSFDFDAGNTWEIEDGVIPSEWQDDINAGWQYEIGSETLEAPKSNIRDKWADIHNFIYLHSPHIKFFNGTFEQFKLSDDAKSTNYKYWCTQGDKAFRLFRYEHPTKAQQEAGELGVWVNAGLFDDAYYNANASRLESYLDAYKVENLTAKGAITQATYNKAVEEGWQTSYARLNEAFIQAYVAHFKTYAHFFINTDSLKFNYAYVLGLLAGTDNSDKNTYYKLMPYAVERESTATNVEEETFASWFASNFGKPFDFSAVHQIYFDGDDMDSIFKTNNNSHQTKPYYIDRMHPFADEDIHEEDCLYEGMMNSLFTLCEKAYGPVGELSKTTNAIFTKAVGLVNDNDVLYGLKSGQKSVWGFLHKYFFNVQYYFPQIAYMEQARVRYEFPKMIGFISTGKGGRNIDPITQSLGSQLLNELQYMNKRVVLFASYAAFGHLGGNTSLSIGLSDTVNTFSLMPSLKPDNTTSDFRLNVRPHQYIYPSYFFGQNSTSTGVRVSPHETVTVTMATNQGDSDTGISLNGINYYSSIGDLGDTSISKGFELQGKRMTEFSAVPTTFYNGTPAFRPSSVSISSPNLSKFDVHGSDVKGSLDLSGIIRCRLIDTRGTKITTIQIPQSQNLESLYLGGNLTALRLENLSNLTNFSIDATDAVTSMYVDLANMPKFTNSKDIIMAMYASYSKTHIMPKEVTFLNVNWTDLPVQVVEWLTKIENVTISGVIRVSSTHEVTFQIKDALNKKFGNVDDKDSEHHKGLIVGYQTVLFAGGSINGNYYNDGKGEYPFSVSPTNQKANSFTKISYSVVNQYSKTSIDPDTGVLKIIELSDLESITTITAIVHLTDGSTIQISKGVEIYNRKAHLGDLVYADGSFGSPLNDDNTKTVVGVCCYVADETSGLYNPKDVQKRLMVAPTLFYIASRGISTNVRGKSSTGARQVLFFPGETPSTTTVYKLPSTRVTSSGVDSTHHYGQNILFPDKIGDTTFSDGTGMQVFSSNTAAGDGYAFGETSDMVEYRTLDYELAQLAGNSYKEKDVVNSGYAATLMAIKQRNRILKSNISYDGVTTLDFQIPEASEGRTETSHLRSLISDIQVYAKETLGDANYYQYWGGLYFPPFSLAYAYEPTVREGEELSDKFKAHNWFLPPGGLLVRIQIWLYHGKDNDIFKEARLKGKFDISGFQTGSAAATFGAIPTNDVATTIAWGFVPGTGGASSIGLGARSNSETTKYPHFFVCAF